jgi:hypothetical protein
MLMNFASALGGISVESEPSFYDISLQWRHRCPLLV